MVSLALESSSCQVSFNIDSFIWFEYGNLGFGRDYSHIGGLCYIELGLLVKKCGADYSYIKEAYSFKKKHWIFEILGSPLAFFYLWASILVTRSASIAIICLTSARYLIRPFYIDCNKLLEKSVVFLA